MIFPLAILAVIATVVLYANIGRIRDHAVGWFAVGALSVVSLGLVVACIAQNPGPCEDLSGVDKRMCLEEARDDSGYDPQDVR